jgi:2',3'-cyclic-nucleotide 2'-phosphodiesterase (5'-nucleotidase family)
LRSNGADFIIYAIHDGESGSVGSYYDTSLSNGYVDLVFEGHSHQQYVVQDTYGVYHMQGGGDNKGVSHAKITINFANDKTKVNKAEFVSTGSYTHLTPDPVVEDLLEKYDEQISQASRLLGKNDKLRSSTEICQTVADLYYEAALEKWGDKYDIVLGGGFLNTRAPYDLSAGNIYYGDLVNVLPFDNQIVLCSIQGRYLQSRFFDLPDRYYISYGEYGESVKANIQNNKTYYLVTDRYTSLYTWNNLTEIEFYDETTYARDLLAEYIEAGNWTQPITMTDIPTLLSIAQGLGYNKETAEVYYVTGKIISIASASLYGNITIEDENGNQLYIYGTWDINGNRYGNMANKPQVGDTVVLCGAMKKYVYNGKVTLEMQNGVFQNL